MTRAFLIRHEHGSTSPSRGFRRKSDGIVTSNDGARRCDTLQFSLVKRLVRPSPRRAGRTAESVFPARSNICVTCLTLPALSGHGTVAAMKLKSNKTSRATVLCAAAVFSLITLRDAQAELPKPGIMPPPPISGPVEGGALDRPIRIRPILPPQPIDNNLGGLSPSEELNGDFSGRLIVD